jgi:hypothetical protein
MVKFSATYFTKLSVRVTTLLQNSPQLEVCIRNYGLLKWQESQFQEFQNQQLGSPKKNDI